MSSELITPTVITYNEDRARLRRARGCEVEDRVFVFTPERAQGLTSMQVGTGRRQPAERVSPVPTGEERDGADSGSDLEESDDDGGMDELPDDVDGITQALAQGEQGSQTTCTRAGFPLPLRPSGSKPLPDSFSCDKAQSVEQFIKDKHEAQRKALKKGTSSTAKNYQSAERVWFHKFVAWAGWDLGERKEFLVPKSCGNDIKPTFDNMMRHFFMFIYQCGASKGTFKVCAPAICAQRAGHRARERPRPLAPDHD